MDHIAVSSMFHVEQKRQRVVRLRSLTLALAAIGHVHFAAQPIFALAPATVRGETVVHVHLLAMAARRSTWNIETSNAPRLNLE